MATPEPRVGHPCRSCWLESILESVADAVIATNCRGEITFMNPAAERLTGCAFDAARSRPVSDVVVLRDRTTGTAVEAPVTRAVREGAACSDCLSHDTVILRPDGSSTRIADSTAPIQPEPGAPAVGAMMVLRDISARHRELERLSFLAEVSVELDASLDYEQTVAILASLALPYMADACTVRILEDGLVTSHAFAHVDPAKARMIRRCFDPSDLDAAHVVRRVMASGQPELVEVVTPAMLAELDGAYGEALRRVNPSSYLVVPIRRATETIGAVTWAYSDSGRHYDANDVSIAVAFADRAGVAVENARLFKALAEARAEADARRKEAERANGTKDEFLAVLGHELRNPLAPIVTALDLMRLKAGESPEQKIIDRHLRHVTRLVDDLLDISRITRSKSALEKQPCDVAEIVARGLELAGPLLEEGRHEVTVSVEPETWVDGDCARLAQVISNLVSNAAKYSERGQPIHVEVRRCGDEAVLRVRDHGIGIAPDKLARVFEPFMQEPQALHRAHGGLGLGLAIARGIVELHGGDVSAHSDGPGRGSEFVVRLPAHRPIAPPRTSQPHESVAWLGVRAGPILVVDDNEDAAALLVEALQLFGCDVVCDADPVSAIARAREVRPSIALLDIGLPVMDGYELARQLRAIDGLSETKFIALTGHSRDQDRARSAAAGFDAHLVKPVTMDELRRTLEQIASPRQAPGARPRTNL